MVIAGLICSHIESLYPDITLKELDKVLTKDIYRDYKKWCRQMGNAVSACSHRFNAARFGKEQWGQFPELSSIYKAAVVKSMLFWACNFLTRHSGSVIGGITRMHCIHGFAKFQYLLDINGPFFKPETTREVVKYGRSGLTFYQELASLDRARTDERRFFKLIPKCHSFFEMTIYIQNTNRNPRSLGDVHQIHFHFV